MTVRPCIMCPICEGTGFETAFVYDRPPQGETQFAFSTGNYYREVLCCRRCGHFISVHAMDESDLYCADYVTSTYGRHGLRKNFDRIVALEPSRSDNAGRCQRVIQFAEAHFVHYHANDWKPSILDVGSGLCVFLHRLKAAGWHGTALDPDQRAVDHARDVVGVETIHGDFLALTDNASYDVVSFNKVLEHVQDPIPMLGRTAPYLAPGGFVYVELPDGEAAVAQGPQREEFFIEHHHIFSAASFTLLAARAGFQVRCLERLQEPSTKFTLRGFLTAA